MRIIEAKRRVLRLRVAAVGVIAAFGVLFAVGALRALYLVGDTGASLPIGQSIRRLISAIYPRNTVALWLWGWAPTFRADHLFSAGNCGFMFVTGWLFLGCIMMGSANSLARRISSSRARAEEIGLEEDFLARQGRPRVAAADVLQLNIDLAEEDTWYKRPVGTVLLTIVATVGGAWLTLKLGLTH